VFFIPSELLASNGYVMLFSKVITTTLTLPNIFCQEFLLSYFKYFFIYFLPVVLEDIDKYHATKVEVATLFPLCNFCQERILMCSSGNHALMRNSFHNSYIQSFLVTY